MTGTSLLSITGVRVRGTASTATAVGKTYLLVLVLVKGLRTKSDRIKARVKTAKTPYHINQN